jgi:hypothetical protein
MKTAKQFDESDTKYIDHLIATYPVLGHAIDTIVIPNENKLLHEMKLRQLRGFYVKTKSVVLHFSNLVIVMKAKTQSSEKNNGAIDFELEAKYKKFVVSEKSYVLSDNDINDLVVIVDIGEKDPIAGLTVLDGLMEISDCRFEYDSKQGRFFLDSRGFIGLTDKDEHEATLYDYYLNTIEDNVPILPITTDTSSILNIRSVDGSIWIHTHDEIENFKVNGFHEGEPGLSLDRRTFFITEDSVYNQCNDGKQLYLLWHDRNSSNVSMRIPIGAANDVIAMDLSPRLPKSIPNSNTRTVFVLHGCYIFQIYVNDIESYIPNMKEEAVVD